MGNLEKKISSREAVVAVIGLGYIGLSLLEAFGNAGYSLLGYDINEEKIKLLKKKKSYLNFMSLDILFNLLDKKQFSPSSNPNILKKADIIVISVPTSLDRHHVPDLSLLRSAFKVISQYLKKDQLIILQSSTYPGTTEEELLPIVQKSGLKVGKEIFLSHVPEVVDIGNKNFKFTDVPRIISGITPNCRKMAEQLYLSLGCEIVLSSSTRVAESAKLLQNAYRLVNISFINEMKIMFDRMKLDVWEVIEMAKSKPFGFTAFEPGPGIGGDCIPITPFYLSWKAEETDGPSTLLEQAGHINENIHLYVFDKLEMALNQHKKSVNGAKILVLGVGYKKNVNDIRGSGAIKLFRLLEEMKAKFCYHDPYVPDIEPSQLLSTLHLKSIKLKYEDLPLYDAVVIITDHSFYDWRKVAKYSSLIIDTRNVMNGIKESKNKVVKA